MMEMVFLHLGRVTRRFFFFGTVFTCVRLAELGRRSTYLYPIPAQLDSLRSYLPRDVNTDGLIYISRVQSEVKLGGFIWPHPFVPGTCNRLSSNQSTRRWGISIEKECRPGQATLDNQTLTKMALKGKASELTAFSPGAEASKAKAYSTTRGQALERINAGMKKKEASKRMEGKVGIITGVGPPTGIGVR